MEENIMRRLVTAFTFLSVLRASTTLRQSCPPPENIHPCTCQTVTPKNTENWVTCDKIESLERLTQPISALRGYHVHKFKLTASRIGYLPGNLFFRTNISEIVVVETEIASFTQSEEKPFSGLEDQLESLSFRKCKLGNGIEWDRLYHVRSLKYVDLSFNSLDRASRNRWRMSHPTLPSLVLKGNRLEGLAEDGLAGLYQLLHLDLSENKLKVLNRSMFPQLSELVIMDLSDNRISSLPEDIFHGMPRLKRVRLNFNFLDTLDEKVWKPIFGQTTHLEVDDNPVVCDEDVCWITRYRPPDYFYGQCSQPEEVRGRSLRSLNFWEVPNCTNPKLFWKNKN